MNLPSLLRAWLLVAASLVVITTARAQDVQQVTIGLSSSSLGGAGYRLAMELGLFQKYRLEPRFVVLDSGNAVTAALISGSLQFGLAGISELIAARARGQNVVAIVNTYGSTSTTMVLSKSVAEKLGVSPTAPVIERLKALDGLVIATTAATSSSTIAYQAAAKRAGATIRSAFMAQNAMIAALESGAIQGFASAAPYWALPIEKGTAVLWINGPKGDLPADLTSASASQVQVMRPFADANPDLVKRIDAIYRDFMKLLEERPAEVKAVIARLYPDLDRPMVDMLFNNESIAWKAKPLTPADVEKEIGFFKLSGTQVPGIDQVDPVAALLSPALLK